MIYMQIYQGVNVEVMHTKWIVNGQSTATMSLRLCRRSRPFCSCSSSYISGMWQPTQHKTAPRKPEWYAASATFKRYHRWGYTEDSAFIIQDCRLQFKWTRISSLTAQLKMDMLLSQLNEALVHEERNTLHLFHLVQEQLQRRSSDSPPSDLIAKTPILVRICTVPFLSDAATETQGVCPSRTMQNCQSWV